MSDTNAVGSERVSTIVGYQIDKGDFSTVTPNLPVRIAMFGEANTANQGTLDLTPFQITSAQQAGLRYGFGSPIHIMARIILPANGGGVGGIPVIVYPQATPVGATAKVINIVPSGIATANGMHTLIIAGREGLEGDFYNININTGDGHAEISAKISDAVNNILGTPVIATDDAYHASLTSKWKGLTANELNVSVNTNGNDLGISYAITSPIAGSGTPSIGAALDLIGNEWVTMAVNGYGTNSNIMLAFEEFNGRPDATNPTGRFVGIVFKPMVALTGSLDENPSDITDDRADDLTIAICPAPLSTGLSMEAAANMCVLEALIAQNNPELDVQNQYYPDMPTPAYIGAMADYNSRDAIVKKGCSTVDLVAGRYQVKDFVTTYHPIGENPPQFRYVRTLVIDNNMRFGYLLLEQLYVVDHLIAADDDIVNADKVVKPKTWKAELKVYATLRASQGLITNAAFMQDSLNVTLSPTNPDRLNTRFNYKRSGFGRISSTDATAGFNFGN